MVLKYLHKSANNKTKFSSNLTCLVHNEYEYTHLSNWSTVDNFDLKKKDSGLVECLKQ
jgi:hypothetical protein